MARPKKSRSTGTLEAQNAQIMANMVVDEDTTEYLKIKILNKLLESKASFNFFPTMFSENMSLGNCPECGHENHFLIPEDELNKLGWVTHKLDPEVPEYASEEVCPTFQESCGKKKASI